MVIHTMPPAGSSEPAAARAAARRTAQPAPEGPDPGATASDEPNPGATRMPLARRLAAFGAMPYSLVQA